MNATAAVLVVKHKKFVMRVTTARALHTVVLKALPFTCFVSFFDADFLSRNSLWVTLAPTRAVHCMVGSALGTEWAVFAIRSNLEIFEWLLVQTALANLFPRFWLRLNASLDVVGLVLVDRIAVLGNVLTVCTLATFTAELAPIGVSLSEIGDELCNGFDFVAQRALFLSDFIFQHNTTTLARA
jgi:hypothetical protein